MRRLPSLLVGILASLIASSTLAQIPEGGVREFEQRVQAADLQPTVAEGPRYLSDDLTTTEVPGEVEAVVEKPRPLDAFLGYRYASSSIDWIMGDRDQFGMVSLNMGNHYQSSGVTHGVDAGIQIHLLSGPVETDMPARVYDFSIAYQHRDRLGVFGYDAAISVMASSDFEGNSREGIRFPSHAVGFLSVGPTTELVFGVDYLDRGDVKLLPVAGLITLPHPDVRLELIFPRPRVVFQLTDQYRLYAGGELGGGTWAIERATMVDDLATYRDLRLSVGLQYIEDNGHRTAVEIGYLFDRRLEYTSGNGNFSPIDTAMIRLIGSF